MRSRELHSTDYLAATGPRLASLQVVREEIRLPVAVSD